MICEHMPPLYTTTELNDNVVENLDEVLSIKSPFKVVIRNAGGQDYVLSGIFMEIEVVRELMQQATAMVTYPFQQL